MTALLITLSVILLLALLRVGVAVQYNEAGTALWLKIGFVKIRLSTGTKQKKKRDFKFGDLKPGSFSDFPVMLRSFKNTLGRLKRRLLIKKLIVHYVSAGDDPAKTALESGAANAVFGIIIPVLESKFRIRHRDLRASADFESSEPKIYVMLCVSIAIWEAFYIISALSPIMGTAARSAASRSTSQKNIKQAVIERKDVKENGERANKQPA